MKNTMMKLSAAMQGVMLREEGQDLIEYALLAALLSLAAVGALKTLATNINSVFSSVGTTLTSA